jgi:DNA-binding LacI/PurR family transcriptional regulator
MPAKRPVNPTVSLKQLAHHVGLSPATVSRIINQSATEHRIAASTQLRVLEAAASLNYNPNVFARGLRQKKSFTVGVMVPEISEGYSSTVLSGIEDELLSAGYFYFVVSHRHKRELLLHYPRLLASRGVEGIIAVDSPLDGDPIVPVVAVSSHKRHKSTINIELDNALAVRYALEHLQQLGHRRIAFIKGQSFSSDTAPRWQAIRQVAAEVGIRLFPELTVELQGDGPGIELGQTAARELLGRKCRFSALFAFNDLAAIGAIITLKGAGLHVPGDVSVIGFDDIFSASTNNPPLTTVRQPMHQMGRTAACTLLRLIRGEKVEAHRQSIQVLPELIERQSTSMLRGAHPRTPSRSKSP